MEFQQIDSFIQIAKSLSFSKTAEKMHVDQSTISTRIKTLEKELGLPLFLRSGKEIRLSHYGHILLPYAEQCIESLNNAKQKLEEEKKNFKDRLRIGVTNPFATFVFPNVLLELYRTFPDLNIQVMRTERSAEISRLVLEGKIDIGFVNNTEEAVLSKHINHLTLYKDPLVLIANPSHPFNQLTHITAEHLGNQKFINFSPATITSNLVGQYFQKVQLNPQYIIEVSNIGALKQILTEEPVLSILPKLYVWEEMKAGTLMELPLSPTPASLVTTLVYSEGFLRPELIKFLKSKIDLMMTDCYV